MLRAMPLNQAQNAMQQPHLAGSRFNVSALPTATRGRVLVIESEKLIRNWLRWVLHSRGYEVVTAANEDEAEQRLYHVGAYHFNLVIVDVNLKHTSRDEPLAGYQLYKTWKLLLPNLRFLLISEEAQDRQLADVKAGTVRLLVKRFVIAELMEVVRPLCRQQTPIHDTAMQIARSA